MKWKEWLSARELKTLSFWRDVFSEFLSTGFLLLYVVLSMVTLNKSVYSVNMTYVGIMVGFMIFVLIEGHGPVSAFMNPCASLAHCLAGRISLVRGKLYTEAREDNYNGLNLYLLPIRINSKDLRLMSVVG